MKFVRLLLYLGAAALVIVAAAAVAALNSTVQTWAARRTLAAQPGFKTSLGSVSAGLQSVEVTALCVERDGAVLTVPNVAAEMAVYPALVRQQVGITRLYAHGWTLDLRGSHSAVGVAGAPLTVQVAAPLVDGLFAGLKLPVDLSLGEIDLRGVLLLPVWAGRPAQTLELTLRGGGMSAGSEGRFLLEISSRAEDGGSLAMRGEIRLGMDSPRSLGRVTTALDAAVTGPLVPQGVKLRTRLNAARHGTAETWTLILADQTKDLANIQAQLDNGHIAGRWQLDLRGADLAPFVLGLPLPEFTAAGEGSFQTDASFAEVHATGRLQVTADKLAAVRPELAAIGAVSVSADFDLLQHGDAVRVERLNATVSGPKPVLTVHALQSFEFNLRTASLSVADPAQDLLWLSLQSLPLAWASPFLGDLSVEGADVRGEVGMSARHGGLAVRTKIPLALPRISVSRAGKPLLRNLDFTASLAADYTPLGWQITVDECALRSAGAPLVTLDFKAGRLADPDQPVKATGRWILSVPALLTQPVVAGVPEIPTGTFNGEFTASAAAASNQLHARVKLSGVTTVDQQALPDISSDLRAEIGADGKAVFSLPLLFEFTGRKSDLLVAGTLVRAGQALMIDAKLTGERVYVEDLQLLAAPLHANPPPPPATGSRAAIAADALPFWSGLSGQIALVLKEVVGTNQLRLADVGGLIRVGQGALRVEGFRAGFGPDSSLKLDAGLTFTAQAASPYKLAADLSVLNFDVAPAFRAVAPAKPPTIEGRVNLTGRLAGDGRTLADLADRAQGEVELTSKGGLFRALSADITDKVQKTQSTVAVIGGILGTVTRKKEFDDLNNKAQILTDISKLLAEIPFDQLSVTATRDASLNLVLKEFTLISPEVRLGGTGSITHLVGTPLVAQPLVLELTLASRGRLADLLKRASLLNGTLDTLGYTSFIVPLKIRGTLDKPDTTELTNALLNSALEKSGLLNTLLGK